jgi:hypothetical protein
MDDGDEIVGSDFIGSDEDELLAKIKQAETEVSNLQPQQQVPTSMLN